MGDLSIPVIFVNLLRRLTPQVVELYGGELLPSRSHLLAMRGVCSAGAAPGLGGGLTPDERDP